MVTFPMTSTDP